MWNWSQQLQKQEILSFALCLDINYVQTYTHASQILIMYHMYKTHTNTWFFRFPSRCSFLVIFCSAIPTKKKKKEKKNANISTKTEIFGEGTCRLHQPLVFNGYLFYRAPPPEKIKGKVNLRGIFELKTQRARWIAGKHFVWRANNSVTVPALLTRCFKATELNNNNNVLIFKSTKKNPLLVKDFLQSTPNKREIKNQIHYPRTHTDILTLVPILPYNQDFDGTSPSKCMHYTCVYVWHYNIYI